jgi:hypothetical protein
MVTTPAPAGTDVVITTPPPAERGPECLPGADASATCAPEEANDTVMMPTSGQAISGWVGASDSTVRSGVAGAPEQAADLLVSNPLVTMPSGFGVTMPSLEESAASAIQQVPGSPLKELLNRDASPPMWTPAAPPGGKALLAG